MGDPTRRTVHLMGSHNVVGEARSWFFGVGLNARACFELCHCRTIAAMHALKCATV